MSPLQEFKKSLQRPDLAVFLRSDLIGSDAQIDGPYGVKPLVYADYVASGRALRCVETFLLEKFLPFYANTHTHASYVGAYCNTMREEARAEIARLTGASAGYSTIFTGSGSTAGINRIVGLLDIAARVRAGERVVVLTGPYEHHSNILPWRETGAEFFEIAEAPGGGPDMGQLEEKLRDVAGADLIVGTFSAASNVTGILTDTDIVTQCLKRHGALAVWDYGCAGPYLPMQMRAGTEAAKDAIVISTHKFPGGPGASGLLILRDEIARLDRPTWPGGGTVSFVSPWGHVYSQDVETREEGGTPNIPGDIRAALCMLVKEALGHDWLVARQTELRQRASEVWSQNSNIEILGAGAPSSSLPIFSFRIHRPDGSLIHHQFFTRLLSDLFGIQARGGCACAGPYAHKLLHLCQAESEQIFANLRQGIETEKPGWVRLNFSALMSDEKVDYVIRAVDYLANAASDYLADYHMDRETARFSAKPDIARDVVTPLAAPRPGA